MLPGAGGEVLAQSPVIFCILWCSYYCVQQWDILQVISEGTQHDCCLMTLANVVMIECE